MRQRTIGLVVVGVLAAGCGSGGGGRLSAVTTTRTAPIVTTGPASSGATPSSSILSDTPAAATGAPANTVPPGATAPAGTDAPSTSTVPSAVPAGSGLPDLLHGASPTDLAVAAIELRSGVTRWTIPRSDDLRGSSGLIGEQPFVFVQSGYCANNVVFAVDKGTGATVWRTPPDLQIAEMNIEPNLTEMVFGDVLVVVLMGARGSTVGVDVGTGTAKWTSGNSGSVIAASTSALVTWSPQAGVINVINVLDPATGNQRWNVRTNPPVNVDTSAPTRAHDLLPAVTAAADGDLVYLDVNNALTAFDATTGVQRWSATMNGSPSGPANMIRGGDVLLIEDSGGITALDAATGARRWTVPNDRDVEQISLHDGNVADGNLYISGPPTVAVINLADGTPRWLMPPDIGAGYVVAAGGGHVLVQDQDQRLHLMDAATGAELWDTTSPTDKRVVSDGATYRLHTDNIYLTWSCGGG